MVKADQPDRPPNGSRDRPEADLDAAALTAQLPEIASLADIGSGAGFPGLPFAILRADCRVTLVESRERRHHFQRQVIRQLGLDNVRAELGRAEALEPSLHAAAIAQAVARPADALPLLLPWVEIGGLLLFPARTPLRQSRTTIPGLVSSPARPTKCLWAARSGRCGARVKLQGMPRSASRNRFLGLWPRIFATAAWSVC